MKEHTHHLILYEEYNYKWHNAYSFAYQLLIMCGWTLAVNDEIYISVNLPKLKVASKVYWSMVIPKYLEFLKWKFRNHKVERTLVEKEIGS